MSAIFVVPINAKFMETCATGTLTGYLVNMFGADIFVEGNTVRLEFEEKSYRWCEKNGGPEEWIMSEFTPRLLIEDILSLQERRGIKVVTSVRKVDA